jgi:hypothetical protein
MLTHALSVTTVRHPEISGRSALAVACRGVEQIALIRWLEWLQSPQPPVRVICNVATEVIAKRDINLVSARIKLQEV